METAVNYSKPLPSPDDDTRPFWDACRAHELRAQRCSACGRFRWPPQGVCPSCYSWDFEWTKLSETGRVASFVVVHYVSVPAFAGDVPYAIANITVDGTDDNVQLTSNVIDIPWEEVKVGMPVRVIFDDVTPDCTLPKFGPA
jgi:uncharacterized OB-fold protein